MANMSEKEKGWPYVVGDGNSNELHTQDDLEKLPENGSHERAAAEHRLVRKLDIRLLPTIFLIFILNHIDVYSLSIDYWLTSMRLLTLLPANSVVVLRLRG
jgi:hypothetical protein